MEAFESRSTIPTLGRLVVALMFILWSGPKLWEVFAEPGESPGLRNVGIATDCKDAFDVNAIIAVGPDGVANVNLTATPEDLEAIGTTCTQLRVDLPGIIESVDILRDNPTYGMKVYDFRNAKPSDSVEFDALGVQHYKNVGEDFLVIDLIKTRSTIMKQFLHHDPGEVSFHFRGVIPHFLFLKSFSSSLFNLEIQHHPTGIDFVLPGLQNKAPNTFEEAMAWTIHSEIILSNVFQITSDAAKYGPIFGKDGTHLQMVNYENGDPAATLLLENSQSARTRDLRIVFAGTIMATGLALFVDFLIDVATLISNARPRSPSKHFLRLRRGGLTKMRRAMGERISSPLKKRRRPR